MHDFTETYVVLVFLGLLTLCLMIGLFTMASGIIIQAVFQKDFGKTLIRFGAACGVIFFLLLPLSLKRFDVFFALLGILAVAGIGMKIIKKTKAGNEQEPDN